MLRAALRAYLRQTFKGSDAAVAAKLDEPILARAGRLLDPRFQWLQRRARADKRRPQDLPVTVMRRLSDASIQLLRGKAEPGVAETKLEIPLDGRRMSARLYRAATQDPQRPAMLYAHSGGGVTGNMDWCAQFCAIIAKTARLPVVSIDYRLAPEHPWPAGLADMAGAYDWLLAHSAEFGAAPDSVGVGGDSMGGNYAAILCQDLRAAGRPQPAFQALVYPATDFTAETGSMDVFSDVFPLTRDLVDWFMSHYLHRYAGGPVDRADLRLSPGKAGDLAGLAPALVATAGFDVLVDQGDDYAERLRAAGVAVDHFRYDRLAHGFVSFGTIPRAEAALRDMAARLDRLIADHASRAGR